MTCKRVGGAKGQEALTSACVQDLDKGMLQLQYATREGTTSLVEKFLAGGAKPEKTDGVKGRGLVVGWCRVEETLVGGQMEETRPERREAMGAGWLGACMRTLGACTRVPMHTGTVACVHDRFMGLCKHTWVLLRGV